MAATVSPFLSFSQMALLKEKVKIQFHLKNQPLFRNLTTL